MRSIFVKDIFTTRMEPVSMRATLDQVVNHLLSGKDPYEPVLDRDGKLYGIISMHDIKNYLLEKDLLNRTIIAADIARTDVLVATPDDCCQDVLDTHRAEKPRGSSGRRQP